MTVLNIPVRVLVSRVKILIFLVIYPFSFRFFEPSTQALHFKPIRFLSYSFIERSSLKLRSIFCRKLSEDHNRVHFT